MYQVYVFILVYIIKTAFSLTCIEVLKLPENKKMNLHELQALEPKEIVTCLSHLGKDEMAPTEAEFIWNSIIYFYNGISNIPEEALIALHYVTIAVKPDEYTNISLSSIDVIANFGLYYSLSDDQLQAIADGVRQDFGNKQPEDYTFYDLTALRQILCAFNRSEIDRIHSKAYKEAASVIGKLQNCNHDVMQGFAVLATHEGAFGPPTSWTNPIVLTVGTVVEFLPVHIKTILKEKLGCNINKN